MSEYRERPRSAPDNGAPRRGGNGNGGGGPPWQDEPRGPPRSASPPSPAPLAAPPPPVIFRPLDIYATQLARPQPSEQGLPALIKAMVGVMGRLKEVPKLGYNKSDKYQYVRSADLLAILQDALLQEGLVLPPREISRSIVGAVIFVTFQYDIWHQDGGYILNVATLTGSARLQFQSGTYDDKAVGKAITGVGKSMAIQVFKIPSDVDDDIERDRPMTDREGHLTGERMGYDKGDRNLGREPPRDEPREPAGGDRRDPPGDARDAGREPDRRDNVPADHDRRGGEHYDEPPFDRRPAAASEGETDSERNLRAFKASMDIVESLKEADRVWSENGAFIQTMLDRDYEDCVAAFRKRWGESPPK